MPIPPLIGSSDSSSGGGGGGGGLPGSGGVARRTPGEVGSLDDPVRKPLPASTGEDDASPPPSSTRTDS